MAPPSNPGRTPKQPEVGPVGEYLIKAVERLRDVRSLTYKKLSEALEAAGRPIFPLGLSRLERGARRVDVDELVALAVALGVSPSTLLLPRDADPDDMVQLTPSVSVRAWIAWQWMDGQMPLPAADPGPMKPVELDDAATADWRSNARPTLAARGRDALVNEAEILLTRTLLAARAKQDSTYTAADAAWWENHIRLQVRRFELALDEEFAARPAPAALTVTPSFSATASKGGGASGHL
jgi:transcriptional regulator with XRE-family HTH domain